MASKARKAWEIEHELLNSAKPETNKLPDWGGISNFEKFNQELLKLFWLSFVPGSGAPEHLVAGAVQSVENMGKDVTEVERLLEDGFQAFEKNDLASLGAITSNIFHLLNEAKDIPGHTYHKFKRPLGWEEIAKHFPDDEDISISPDILRDKIYGGWVGQICGASMGTAIEGYTHDALIHTFGDKLGTYLYKPSTINDDITYEIAFLLTYEEFKQNITSKDIALKWVAHIPFGWSAEYVALENLKRGIYPPLSGRIANPYQEWIGAQMRCMMQGLVSPGKPRKAARLAFLDSQISHSGNGIYGGIHSAVLTSLAFVYNKPRSMVKKSVEYIPEGTEFREVVSTVIRWCEELRDWEEVLRKVESHFKEYNWVHLYPNTAGVITSLWFGESNFERTMKIIASFGYDVDCNAGEVGTVLGVIMGIDGIDSKWYKPFNGIIETYMQGFKKMKISELVERTINSILRFNSNEKKIGFKKSE
jgi:ADP-ribosylglycohydrolase